MFRFALQIIVDLRGNFHQEDITQLPWLFFAKVIQEYPWAEEDHGNRTIHKGFSNSSKSFHLIQILSSSNSAFDLTNQSYAQVLALMLRLYRYLVCWVKARSSEFLLIFYFILVTRPNKLVSLGTSKSSWRVPKDEFYQYLYSELTYT